MKNKIPFLMGLTVVMGGCNGGMDLMTQHPPLQASQAEQQSEAKSTAEWGLSFPQVMEFKEGVRNEYTIEGWVPNPGNALISVDPLPEGAQFDAATGKLSWTPSNTAANDPSMPASDARHYTLNITLKSSTIPEGIFKRQALLLVRNTPGTFKIELPEQSLSMVEGQEFTQIVRVSDEDFPEGPFSVRAEGLPFGASIEPGTTKNEFVIHYTPSPKTVSASVPGDAVLNDATGVYERHFTFTAFGYNPRGEEVAAAPATLVVADKRMAPIVSGPSDISQEADVSFAILAEDTNGEGAPEVSVDQQPSQGRFSLTQAKEGTVTRVEVQWGQIPKEAAGSTVVLGFKACAPGAGAPVCTALPVTVRIQPTPKNPPTIGRTQWPVGTFRYMRTGDGITVPVQVADADFPDKAVTVVVRSTDSSDGIQFTQDGGLTITAGKAGFRQIALTATSFQGSVAEESFALMVLPKK